MKIVEDVIIALIVAAISAGIIYMLKNIKQLKVVMYVKLIRSIKNSGMTHFFYNKDIMRKQLGTVGNEIGKAKKQFIYIGYTMSDIIRQDMEEAIIKAVNERNVHFEFCILDENSECASLYAKYTGRDIEQVALSIKETEKVINNIRRGVPEGKKEYVKLLKHDMFIPSSCFLGDIGEESGWIHFNYKAPRAIKFQDFGFVLSVNKKSEFYDKMKASYLAILNDIYTYNNDL